ncbi:MAG: hypothetical protein Q9174_005548 [Haloplaca sp. 1 TL-2023]
MITAFSYLQIALAFLICLCFAYGARQTICSPLNSLPGPCAAKFTNLWQAFTYFRGKQYSTIRELHDRYGPAVRLGPKHVSLNDPSLIKKIYSLKGDYIKTKRYQAADSLTPTMFSTANEQHQSIMWKPIAPYFTMTNVLSFEPHIDDVIRLMHRRMNEQFCDGKKAGMVCDLHKWLNFGQYLRAITLTSLTPLSAAWEVIMKASVSDTLGLLDRGEDVDNTLADALFAADAFAYLGHLPWLESLLRRFSGKPLFDGALQFSLRRIQERQQLGHAHLHTPPDFLDNFLTMREAKPELVTDDIVVTHLINNVAAGGDTTTATMAGVVYQTLKRPHVLKRLQQELDDNVEETPVSWKVASGLVYLDAVIQESLRFHPAVSFALERVVPREGLKLPDGRFLPPGTIVGMHPWIVSRDKSVFGPDADSFVPERWLQEEGETTSAFSSRIARMKNCVLSFGAGKRRCAGKHLAFLEMYKILSTLFAKFEIELLAPTKEAKMVHAAVVRFTNFHVILKPREKFLVPSAQVY